MQRIVAIVILLAGISCGAWLPCTVAVPISIITGWIAGTILAQNVER